MDKIELLYDHYKETFLLIQENIKQRNKFFIIVFFTMLLHFLFASSPESIAAIFINIIQAHYEIDISIQNSIIQSALWLVLLYSTMRYYQTTVYIEKQYKYISSIESNIECYSQITFNRESGNYLLDYPKMNDFIDILYKWIFPIIYCGIISYKIGNEFFCQKLSFLLVLDIIIFIFCFTLTTLYLIFLHGN